MAWFNGWGFGGGAPSTAPTTASNLTSLGTMPMSHAQLGTGLLPQGGASGPFEVGELVEYYSTSQGTWILAKVLAKNAKGTYNLDCKPDVSADKIRRPQGSATAVMGSDAKPFSTGTYAVGEMVEYFSASQNKWIPAKVLAANPKGTYNLDCKPDVSTDKIRKMDGAAAAKVTAKHDSSSQANGLRASGQGGSGMGGFFSNFLTPSTSKTPPELRAGLQEAPLQLLRVRKDGGRWQYEVCEEGARLLERYGSRRISVVSICGLYRTGKSYLLNLLLERVQRGQSLFQVGNTSRPCTEGLWLWGSMDSDDDHRPLLAFLDCEGFGSTDSDKTRDAQLLTLCALLSSVLVLNTKGVLNESLFNALALTCKFAEHIEERGNEASRPALVWVLRDFMLELRDANGRPTSPDEYLEQALSAAPTSTDQQRGQGAREVRQSLLKFFGHRSCVTLVQPAVEERQLQNLASTPYSSLRPEFRAGVEALRTQILTTGQASPKTVSGHPLGCFGFVQLIRQLVSAMNAQRALSVKGAWETVQHSACGSLSEELNKHACTSLRTLASGSQLPGGAHLPLTDEALRMVLRHQRHELKAEWEERAVGDEVVRKEYWQELKESLAREEALVRQQNARIADQRLVEALRYWQEWLDDENGSWAAGERICKDLGELMDKMPAAPLSRTARAAVEAAGRRVAAARSAVTATNQQSQEAQRQAFAFGEKEAQQHGAARSELEVKAKELRETHDALKQARHDHSSSQAELQAHKAELVAAKDQLQKLLNEIDECRVREHEHKAKHVDLTNREGALRSDFDNIQQAFAKAQADHLTAERLAQASADTWEAERRRLEAEIGQLKTQVTDRASIERELEDLKGKAREEKSRLSSELEQVKGRHEEVKGHHDRLDREKEQLASELETLKRSLSTEKERLMQELDQARTHHTLQAEQKNRIDIEKARIEDELEKVKLMQEKQTSEKKQNEQELEQLRQQVREKIRLENELQSAKAEALRATAEASLRERLESERDQLREQVKEMQRLEGELHEAKLQASEKRKLENDLEALKKSANERDHELQGFKNQARELQNEVERNRREHERTKDEAERTKADAERKINEAKNEIDRHKNEHEKTKTEHEKIKSDAERTRAEASNAHEQAQRVQTLQEDLQKEASEKRKLATELDIAKKQAENAEIQLRQERDNLTGDIKRKEEHIKLVEDTRKKLEEERKAHVDRVENENQRLLNEGKKAWQLEGKVQTLEQQTEEQRSEAQRLRDQLIALEAKAREAEQLKQDLEKEKAAKVQTAEELRTKEEKVADLQEKLNRAEAEVVGKGAGKGGKQKCAPGCSVM